MIIFRNLVFVSCDTVWFAWANVTSEMPANQEYQPDIHMRTIALTILIAWLVHHKTSCVQIVLFRQIERSAEKQSSPCYSSWRCLLLYFGMKNTNLVSLRRRISILTNPTISWRKGWLAQWNGGKGEAKRFKSFFMMRRLNQFQVSELFPLLNFRRHTVEEVQKEGQELAHC